MYVDCYTPVKLPILTPTKLMLSLKKSVQQVATTLGQRHPYCGFDDVRVR